MLHVSVLWIYLLLPSLLCENLLCYYSPVLEKELEGTLFEPILTECPPEEVCYKAEGLYGNFSALLARGCMPRRECGQVDKVRVKGVIYTMHRTCCDSPHCNICTGITVTSALLFITVAVTVGIM
ncbi:protein Bouncer [Sphaeramia orbicularis]|uniref:protein Bouncer n=1 Tax=Sphaeramia orbicularis TaxID=375764 RepID=UPI00117C3168|nr:protein Bouncer-like [Sphaeramia orbicularis]